MASTVCCFSMSDKSPLLRTALTLEELLVRLFRRPPLARHVLILKIRNRSLRICNVGDGSPARRD